MLVPRKMVSSGSLMIKIVTTGAVLDMLDGTISTATDMDSGLMRQMQALTADIDVDLDAPILGEVDLRI